MRDKTVRCDQCYAEAWVTVKHIETKQQLDFCAHDYNKNSIMLHAQGWAIANDERELINKKPSISANAE